MMKTIIIPADLTNYDNDSLETALIFEKIKPIEIVLSFSSNDDKEQVESRFQEINSQITGKLQHSGTNLKYVIEDTLKETECGDITPTGNDNLILVSYGKDESAKNNSVETTIRLIRSCRQNYMTIPKSNPPDKITKIVFPIHPMTKVRHKVTFTSVIAKMFNAQVDVITLQTTNQKDILKRMNLYTLQIINHLKNYGIQTNFETLEGKKVPEMILDYTQKANADAVSIIPEDVTGPRFFSKGFLYEMIEQSDFPLIVVAPRKAKISGSFSASAG